MRRYTHRNKLPLVWIVGLLVLSLATMGIAYGLWSEALSIEGVVYTGEVDAKWTFVSCAEFYPWPTGGNAGEVEGKDVGSVQAWIDETDDTILHVRVENGYPSYAGDCQVHFMIEGSIPIIVRGTTIIPGTNLSECALTGTNAKTLACNEMTIKFVDNLGSQLHPGDEAASSIMFHVEQPAAENEVYEFSVGVCMGQWNEDVTAEECFAAGE